MKMSEHLKVLYINTRYITEKDVWPPDQPKHFTTLVFLQQQGQPSQQCVIALEEENASGNITAIMSLTNKPNVSQDEKPLQEYLSRSKATKNISDPLRLLENPTTNPRTILIEGAPGIGKTFLLKHIAFEWANNKMLTFTSLVFLLCLRDPAVQAMSSIDDLVHYFFKQGMSTSKNSMIYGACLSNSDGKNVIFLLDGYDELPEKMQKNGFITDILNHKILPASGVVITSRPYATAHLQNNVACLISILGFSEEDRRKYIEESLKDQPEKAQELLEYLDDHITIDNLCYIPFHLTVLMFLYKRGFTLPDNETQMYEYFVITTIRRYLSKHNISFEQKFSNLNELPDPYGTIIDKLATLSYAAIGKQQTVFTLKEITSACPEILSIPEGMNGLGLMQAVQHFDIADVNTTVNFLHLSLQEFLAAYHIACLPPDKEFNILQESFFNDIFSNTLLLYVGLTKGQHRAFKYFLYGGGKQFSITSMFFEFFNSQKKISSVFFRNQGFCYKLIRCLHEAGETGLSMEIASHPRFYIHDHKPSISIVSDTVDRQKTEALCTLLICKQVFEVIDIHASGTIPLFLQKIYKPIRKYTPTIDTFCLALVTPCITVFDSQVLANIVITSKVRRLIVDDNELNSSDWIHTILSHDCAVLEELSIGRNGITSATAIDIFSIITNTKYKKLRYVGLYGNLIGDQAVHKIISFLQQDLSLKKVYFDDNKLSESAVLQIIHAIKCNETLNVVSFGYNPLFCKRTSSEVKKVQLEINKNRSKSNQFSCIFYQQNELGVSPSSRFNESCHGITLTKTFC